MDQQINKVAVIGAGTMGNGIAHVFAMKDYQVTLIDISAEALDRAIQTITKNLDRMVRKEKINEDQKNRTLSNIKTQTELKSGVADADLVIEAATENEAIKLKIFQEIDQNAPEHAILASNLSLIHI